MSRLKRNLLDSISELKKAFIAKSPSEYALKFDEIAQALTNVKKSKELMLKMA